MSRSDTRYSLEIESYTPRGGYLWRSEVPKTPLRDQFIWIAYLKAKSGRRDEMLAACLTYAGNVHRTEDETLSLVVLEKNDDDHTIVLFERYTSEDYFEKVAKTSEAMKQYWEKVRSDSSGDRMSYDGSRDGKIDRVHRLRQF